MANYNSAYTGAQIDNAVGKANNPDTTPTVNSGNLISSGGVKTALDAKAPIASPAFTGSPTAPTPPGGNNSTRLATTEFVASVGGLGQAKEIVSNSDLNNFTVPGSYYFLGGASQTIANWPEPTMACSLLVLSRGTTSKLQFAIAGTSKIYARREFQGDWSEWTLIAGA